MSRTSALPSVDTPWMLADEAAAYMKFDNVNQLYRFLDMHSDFPRGRRGRVILIDRTMADAWLRGDLKLRHKLRAVGHGT